ncbi:hypothetical protein FZEAL_9902 [Fusarium zealandicum]|uniref:Oxidoreductase n=1 Tax=Fusarium zealandicum TaxID=1053134 RepID=A0A8H4U823_9HYPO|nr:hypothetical protein FZEAL_9902 [Fusarium zealandicum]
MSSSPVWFISAASSGFGHETALQALKRGHRVIATARNPSRIQDLADAGAHTLAFDVTAPLSAIEAIAKDVFAKHGRVDYLVNAAGFILEGAVEEMSPEEAYDSFNTNVFGTINMVKAYLPGMRAQDIGSNGRRSTIATFGSIGVHILPGRVTQRGAGTLFHHRNGGGAGILSHQLPQPGGQGDDKAANRGVRRRGDADGEDEEGAGDDRRQAAG